MNALREQLRAHRLALTLQAAITVVVSKGLHWLQTIYPAIWKVNFFDVKDNIKLMSSIIPLQDPAIPLTFVMEYIAIRARLLQHMNVSVLQDNNVQGHVLDHLLYSMLVLKDVQVRCTLK